MKAAMILEVFRRRFGSLGAAEEQEAWKALVRRRLSDADDPKLFKRCRDQIERAHDVCLSSKPDGVPVPQERRMVMTWLLYDIAREAPTDEAEERSPLVAPEAGGGIAVRESQKTRPSGKRRRG